MKILFLITQSEFGGAQHFLANLITSLEKDKYDILVCAGPEGDNKAGLLNFLEKKGVKTKHLKYLRRAINPLFDLFSLIEIYRFIRKEKPDILFLCSSKAGVLGSLTGYVAKVSKIIYRIGGWTFNDPWPKWKKKLYFWIEKWSAKFKDIIIINSKSDRDQALKLGIKPKEKILTVYNGIDFGQLKFLPRKEARNQLKKKISNQKLKIADCLIIGTIANLYPAKSLEHLIEAAYLTINRELNPKHRILNPVFIVIGEGEERRKLEGLIKKYHLENNFFLLGAIPDAYKYLKAFDIFVLSSVKEGFPWTILEAITAKVPIIATKVGAIPEIIDNKRTGLLVRPAEAKELSEAIAELIDKELLRHKLVEQANKTIRSRFDLKNMVSEIKKIL
jgi:glycosyltransferase involved in cell wall biosynthesis